jgi:succinoglycan biosynthesis protein ExoL
MVGCAGTICWNLRKLKITGKSILILARDLADIAQLRRIQALQSVGYCVQTIGFRRSTNPVTGIGSHLDLGPITNERLGKRLWRIFVSVPVILKCLRQGDHLDLIYVRNLDMLLLAWILRCLTWSSTPMFYEVLDIHSVLTNGGFKQRFTRALEGFLLRRVSRLIVSSPDFITQYFIPIQSYDGDWVLLENKVWHGALNKVRPSLKPRQLQHKIRVGWLGNIRCKPSLKILMKLADNMENVEIHIHGKVHEHLIPHFDQHVAARRNVFFHGRCDNPVGLSKVYSNLDVIWAQDLCQTGANSSWLLPSRIYEAAWHGCPSICISGTATAGWVSARQTGYVIDDADGLKDLLVQLDCDKIFKKRQLILAQSPNLFCMSPAELINAITPKPTSKSRLPDFVCVGAMRAGTTALYDYCAEHPEIGVSATKETDFFIKTENWHRGVDWYKRLFPTKTKVCGEFSPNYTRAFVFPNVPERMHKVLPNAKIIYIVRHPVDRAISQYNHAFRSGQKPPEMAHLLGSHEWAHLIDTSCYFHQIKLFLRHYHASQLLVINYDDLVDKPDKALAQVAGFLGVSNRWGDNFDKRINSPKSMKKLPKFVQRTSNFLIVMGIKPYLPLRARRWLKARLETHKSRVPPPFSNTIKRAMWMDMYGDIREFSKLTGIHFAAPIMSEEPPHLQSKPRPKTALRNLSMKS